MTERDVQTAIVEVLRKMGWEVRPTSDKRRSIMPGMPDLYCRHYGRKRRVWLEVKGPGGKPSQDQLDWIERERAAGGEVHIVYSLEEALEVVA